MARSEARTDAPAGRQAALLLGVLIAVGLAMRLVVFRGAGFPSDVGTFMAWAERMAALGPGGFYEPGYFSDYPPGFLYVLWLIGAALDGEALRLAVKLLSIPADVAVALFLAAQVRPRAGAFAAAMAGGAWMVQPGVVLAGPFWGQIDAWGTLPFLGALVAAGRGRWALAGALAGLAGMVKPQFGLVALVVGGAAAIELVRMRRWRPLALVVGSGLAVALALAFPFRMTPGAYIDLVREASETYQYTSLYAFNIWSIVGDFWKPDDQYVAAGGVLLVLGLAGSVALLWRRRDVPTFLAAGALAAMAFYFLPTRAHERYLFPAFALLLPFAVVRPRMRIPYAVLSLGFFATLYFAFTRYAFTEVTAPPLLEATLFSRTGQIVLALAMLGSAALIAWYLARGEARLRVIPSPEPSGIADAPPRRWRLPEGLRLGYAPSRRDVALALLVALAVIATRGYRLDHPRDMYFDEVYHARTAFELLAEREPYEWTHPHLAKEIMALGILAFGSDRVESSEAGVADATAFAVSKNGARAYGFADGRVLLRRPGSASDHTAQVRGAVRGVAFDGEDIYVLTEGAVSAFGPTLTPIGPPAQTGRSVGLDPADPPTAFAAHDGRAIVGTATRVIVHAMRGDVGPTIVSVPVMALTAKPDSNDVYVADPTGVIHVIDLSTGTETAAIVGGPPVSALAYARGPNRIIGAELDEARLTWYEPSRVEGSETRGGSYSGSVVLSNSRTGEITGPVLALALVPETQFAYALTERGVVVVEPHGMSPYALIPASGSMLGVDGSRDALLVAGSGETEIIPTGRHALAWRIPGVAFGALLAFFIVLLARRLFAARLAPAIAGAVVLLDGSMFAQARIGMNDVYVATFIVMGWYFVVAAHRPRRSAYVDLLLAGICFGLALATKWVAAYALAGLALYTVATTAFAWARGRPGTGGPFDLLPDPPIVAGDRVRALARLLVRPLVLLACFAAVPVALYLAAYLPWFGGKTIPFGWNLVELTQQMYWYHSGLTAPHPAGSPWWSWPLVLKPVYWYLGSPGQGHTAVIYDAGNIVLFWGALAATIWAAVAAWRTRSIPLAFLLFALLTQYVAWIPITRVLFFYHFFTALPFYLLILTAVLVALWERRRAAFVATYLAIAAAAFVFFYPFVSGQPLPADQASVFYVLPTWQYDCQWYPAFRCDSAFRGELPVAAAAGRLAIALGSALLVLAAMTVLFRDGQRHRILAWATRLVPRRG